MRTPTEVFEAVLDAWDKSVRLGRFRASRWCPVSHQDQLAAYREEFRQAMAMQRLADRIISPEPASEYDAQRLRELQRRHAPPEPTASAEEAFQGACPPVPSREPFFMSSEGLIPLPGQPVKPPLVGPGDWWCCSATYPHHAPGCVNASEPEPKDNLVYDDEEFRRRRDESAERYTKDDGSVK